MGLTISVDLVRGVYDAGDPIEPARAEWPPHPARLFCALVAGAPDEGEREALRWLERQPPPLVVAEADVDSYLRTGYVVTNELVAEGKNQSHLGRTNKSRQRAHAVPVNPWIRFVWPDAAPDDAAVSRLDALARRMPYLGRATSLAVAAATATTHAGESGGDVAVYEASTDSEVTLRVPFEGYLAQLDDLFAEDRPSWTVSKPIGYRRRRPPATPAPDTPPSAYEDFVIYRFTGVRPDGRLAPRFTEALRSTVLSRAGDDSPDVLHGHGADGRPHVAFLALPDVAHEHADGHLLGMAVAVPVASESERRAVLRAALGDAPSPGQPRQLTIRVAGMEVVLRAASGRGEPWGTDRRRWLGARSAGEIGSLTWVSATPVVLDRYPKRELDDAEVVRRSCRMLGLPDPVDVRVSTAPFMPGAIRLQPSDLPKRAQGRPFRHVSLRFDRPIRGPLILGAGRYLGVGLMAPTWGGDEDRAEEAAG